MSGGMEEAAIEEKEYYKEKSFSLNVIQEKDLWELHSELITIATLIKNLLENRK